jgi:2-aminoadipate transaminase
MDEQLDELQRRAAADPRVIGLAGGLPNKGQFPRRALARSFLRAVRQAGTPALQYGWPEGSERLRAFVADRLRARGADVVATDVLITSGAQQAIAIALELTCRAGDRVAVDAETYPAALDLLRARRLRPVARADALDGARAAYAMPALGNPRGLALDAAARGALLGSALPIIEDDAYADLRFDGPAPRPLLADAPGRVFHVGTLSKTLCPGLRIGWLVAPRRLRRRALVLKQGDDLQASSLAQAVVEQYLAGGADGPGTDFDARLVRLRRFYWRRAALLARALRRHLPGWRFAAPEGGFAIWAEADAVVDDVALLERALAAGVSFDPGSAFRPSSAGKPTAMRLCFSLAPATALDEGVRRLAAAWRRARRRR